MLNDLKQSWPKYLAVSLMFFFLPFIATYVIAPVIVLGLILLAGLFYLYLFPQLKVARYVFIEIVCGHLGWLAIPHFYLLIGLEGSLREFLSYLFFFLSIFFRIIVVLAFNRFLSKEEKLRKEQVLATAAFCGILFLGFVAWGLYRHFSA